jgi:hypothetical protein
MGKGRVKFAEGLVFDFDDLGIVTKQDGTSIIRFKFEDGHDLHGIPSGMGFTNVWIKTDDGERLKLYNAILVQTERHYDVVGMIDYLLMEIKTNDVKNLLPHM